NQPISDQINPLVCPGFAVHSDATISAPKSIFTSLSRQRTHVPETLKSFGAVCPRRTSYGHTARKSCNRHFALGGALCSGAQWQWRTAVSGAAYTGTG